MFIQGTGNECPLTHISNDDQGGDGHPSACRPQGQGQGREPQDKAPRGVAGIGERNRSSWSAS